MSKRKTTEQFIEEAKLIHGDKYDYSLVDYKNNQTKVKIICKKHNIVFLKNPSSFLKSCNGCKKCEIERKSKKKYTTESFLKRLPIDLKKYNYDYSKVEYKGIYNKIEIVCPKHGSFKISPTKLMLGHKCSECKKEEMSEKFRSDTNTFIRKCKEKFKNINYDYSLTKYGKNAKDKIKIICPNCGVIETTPLNFFYSDVGCPNCNKHKYKGEEIIKNYLLRNNIIFEKPKKFNDLKDKRNLSYDFYLLEKNILIEYNGKQHYKNAFDKTLHEFHIQKHHDWLKRKYAKKHNIKLLVIPYWEYKNIENILKENIW